MASIFTKTSIARKVSMALSALFLLVFLLQHFTINITSVFSPDTFNELSHFMGYNPAVQFVAQPLLMFGVAFHFIMGFILEARNRSARPERYVVNNGAANSTLASRSMIYSGLFILGFLAIHLWDFWFPEMSYKYINGTAPNETRYYEELVHKFSDLWRVIVYCITFVFLALHLLHGFQSSFQSLGARHPRYTPAIKTIGNIYAIVLPAGFIFIALFHYVNGLNH